MFGFDFDFVQWVWLVNLWYGLLFWLLISSIGKVFDEEKAREGGRDVGKFYILSLGSRDSNKIVAQSRILNQ